MDRQRLLLATSIGVAAASVLDAGYVSWLTIQRQAPPLWGAALFVFGFIGLPTLVLAALPRAWRAGAVLLTVGPAHPTSRRAVYGLFFLWVALAALTLSITPWRLATPFFTALAALHLGQTWGRVQLRERGIATGTGLLQYVAIPVAR